MQDRKCEAGGRKKLDARWWGTLGLLDVVSAKDRGTTAITHDGGRNNSSASDLDMLFATNQFHLMFCKHFKTGEVLPSARQIVLYHVILKIQRNPLRCLVELIHFCYRFSVRDIRNLIQCRIVQSKQPKLGMAIKGERYGELRVYEHLRL